MSDAPRCSICGKEATDRDIDGNWWPPCGHAKTHGIETLAHSAPDLVTCRFCGERVPEHSIHDCRVARNFTAGDWELVE